MINYPKISIVTPVLNRVDFIESTIKSVLSQGYPNLEYIIIDGGSTDGTVEVIRKYEDKLAYWISEPDNGMYYAIQKGFDKATGEIYAWLNSDDLYHENSLFVIADIFTSFKNVSWLIGIPSLYNKNGHCVKVFPMPNWSKQRFIIGDYMWIQQESTFWRKSLWIKAGSKINFDYKFAADFELWTRFFDEANLYAVNTILSGFRMHGNQLSFTNNVDYENEVEKIYKKHYGSLNFKQSFLFHLFKFQQYCNGSNIFLQSIRAIINVLIKKSNKNSAKIYFDFTLNKWKCS